MHSLTRKKSSFLPLFFVKAILRVRIGSDKVLLQVPRKSRNALRTAGNMGALKGFVKAQKAVPSEK